MFASGANVENLTLTGSANLNGTGNALNNILNGNSGNNTLNGGAGADTMTGGLGADRFYFANGQFGGLTYLTADRITDFSSAQGDKIGLAAVDANTGIAGDQAFTFIGTAAFSNTAGELHYTNNGVDTLLEGDTNGDGVADFAIKLDGLFTLQNSDFVL